MEIELSDQYIGIVLSQLVKHSPTITFTQNTLQKNRFSINDQVDLLITSAYFQDDTWSVIMMKDELKDFEEAFPENPLFLACVCENQFIALLSCEHVAELVGGKFTRNEMFMIEYETKNYLRFTNNNIILKSRISINSFPSAIWDAIPISTKAFAWPALCEINVYREAPQKIFSSRNRFLDLSDVLADNLLEGEIRVKYVSVSTQDPKWDIWDEHAKRKIEQHIHYLFEFEDIAVEIERVSKIETWCTNEFIWKITFWRDHKGLTELLEAAKDIVLTHQNTSASFLGDKLGVPFHQAINLLNQLAIDGLLSQISSNGTYAILSENK